MSYFSFKVQNRTIFTVLNLKKKRLNWLAFGILAVLYLDLNLRKKMEKIILLFFSKMEIFQKNVILRPIFRGF